MVTVYTIVRKWIPPEAEFQTRYEVNLRSGFNHLWFPFFFLSNLSIAGVSDLSRNRQWVQGHKQLKTCELLRHWCESHTQEFESTWSHIHQCFILRGFYCHIVTFSLWHAKKSCITLYREQSQNLFLKFKLIDPPVLPFAPIIQCIIKIEFSSFRTKFYSD